MIPTVAIESVILDITIQRDKMNHSMIFTIGIHFVHLLIIPGSKLESQTNKGNDDGKMSILLPPINTGASTNYICWSIYLFEYLYKI